MLIQFAHSGEKYYVWETSHITPGKCIIVSVAASLLKLRQHNLMGERGMGLQFRNNINNDTYSAELVYLLSCTNLNQSIEAILVPPPPPLDYLFLHMIEVLAILGQQCQS